MDSKQTDVGDFLRNKGLQAFNGSKDLAFAAVKAATAWYSQLDGKVKFALDFASKKLEAAAWKRLAELVASSGGLVAAVGGAAEVVGELALFLAALVASFEIGVFLTSAAVCIDA
ncbi:hypothetical protein [Streptomyces sp. NRRL WC-3742]|uniref:hypothetical protein n=1 Tax=Streptomyces sp. NRRL WC-3742 TaxID=1463934 RepID=UPI0004C58B64|nr:hypothetical protein [Streptomyces sp. NRRL WC-3742]